MLPRARVPSRAGISRRPATFWPSTAPSASFRRISRCRPGWDETLLGLAYLGVDLLLPFREALGALRVLQVEVDERLALVRGVTQPFRKVHLARDPHQEERVEHLDRVETRVLPVPDHVDVLIGEEVLHAEVDLLVG